MKIIFFGTSNFALPCLEVLHGKYELAAVVTTPDAKVGRRQQVGESPVSALARDLNLTVFKPENLKSNDDFRQQLQALQPDLFVVAAFGKILPKDLIDLPKFRTLNVHPSLLPKYRGASPIQFALLNGETQTGVSIIVMDGEVDHGPILAQESIAIDSDDNFITLSEKLAYKAAGLLEATIEDYVSGKIRPLPQDESQATTTKIVTRQDGKVDWSKSAAEIYNQFRAFYPWPGLWTTWNKKVLKILDCLPTESPALVSAQAGEILPEGIVACGQSTFLKLNSLQLESKNETGIQDFLNGYQTFVGSRLGQ